MPALVVHARDAGFVMGLDLDQYVTGEELALGTALLAGAHFHDFFSRDEDVAEQGPGEGRRAPDDFLRGQETGLPEERGEVAGVFVNRLRDGMRLQTDPTVIYGVTEGRGILDRGLRRSELQRRTPYNTYVIEGLPPTPIANPGLAAIEAALNPEETDYLFFVADGSGGHAFARTLQEHEANVARWREIEAQQGAAAESAVQTAD